MVKPGGTGMPMWLISARPAPLPPSSSFMPPRPSARPPPKEYVRFAPFLLAMGNPRVESYASPAGRGLAKVVAVREARRACSPSRGVLSPVNAPCPRGVAVVKAENRLDSHRLDARLVRLRRHRERLDDPVLGPVDRHLREAL